MAHVVLRPHAPLMWVLVPLMIGYGLANGFLSFLGEGVGLGLLLPTAATLLMALWAWGRGLWRMRLYAAFGVGLLACLTYALREPLPAIAPEMIAPREATLIIEVQQQFASRGNNQRVSGLGVVRDAPEPMKSLIGQRISYGGRWRLSEPIENGAWIAFRGVLAPVNGKPDNEFDGYLMRLHVFWSLSRGVAVGIQKPASPLMHWVAGLHRQALEIICQRWDNKKVDGMIPAMALGDKSGLTQKQLSDLSRSSTTHLIVPDGLNVVAVGVVLWVVARLTGLPRLAQALLVILGLGVYALMVGAAPSILRAWGMATIVLGAWAASRQMNGWAVLVLAATVSLIVEPLTFLHAGWRLSFAVVGGIILGMSIVERWGILEKLRRFPRWVAHTCAVSIAASLAVAPLTMAYWGIAQPLGFLVNAVTVTLGETVKILGTASFLLGWAPWLSKTINEVSGWLIAGIEWFIQAYLKIPGAVVDVAGAKSTGVEVWGTVGVLAVFYVLARYGWPKRKTCE